MRNSTYYLDANFFHQLALGEGRKANAAVSVAGRIVAGELKAVTTFLTWDEITWVLRRTEGRASSIAGGKCFLELEKIFFFPVTIQVVQSAQRLISEYEVKPRDAIHAATAILCKCEAIVSDDKDFDLLSKEIPRISIETASGL